MAIVDGWVDWAVVYPGVAGKLYSEPNRGLGLIGHSIVGTAAAAFARFMSTERDSSGRFTPYASASCMFVLMKSGSLYQMYPVTASTWTSGGREANTSLWAIEAEGGPPGNESEPLTDAQVATLLRLCGEFEAHTGRAVMRGTTFREHGEVARQYGYAPTACPSNRYQRFYEALDRRQEEDEMTADQVRDIVRDEIRNWRLQENQREEKLLGATSLLVVEALVRRSRATAKAKSVEDVVKANDPEVVP